MIAGIVVTHGPLAAELVNSAKTIVASPTALFPVCLNWSDTWEDSLKKVRFVLDKLDGYRYVLLFTDMFGGTPSNIAFSLARPERIEVITGVNLPMLVRFLSIQHENLDGLREISYFLCQRARQSIRVFGLKEDHDQ